jgi:putative N6-adenine-specific DNA methylase
MPALEQFFSPCPRGLEAVLAGELEPLGAEGVRPLPGGVQWQGSIEACYRANLWSRTASRVLLRVGSAHYRNEDDLYRAACAIDWQARFAVERTIRVDVTAIRSPLASVDFAVLRIKDAICDQFRDLCGERPSVDTRNPDVRVSAFLDDREAVFYLDTSGEPLFKRGYRRARREAPLKENLAAGLILLSGWNPDEDAFFDPMCGSGTLAMEAALIATRTAPGAQRRFGFEALRNHDQRLWQRIRDEAAAGVLAQPAHPIVAGDRDRGCIDDLQASLDAFDLTHAVECRVGDVLDAEPPAAQGVWVTNPPYGVRMGTEDELAGLFKALGGVLKRGFAGWRCLFVTADMKLPRQLGLHESRRTPIFNGRLECRLFEFKMVAGSLRRRSADTEGPV